MKYKFKATQTLFHYFEVEAENEDDAFQKANAMVNEGDISFDKETFLNMECDLNIVE